MTFSKNIKKNLLPTYQSKNLAKIFYSPLLLEADSYQRVSAYFSGASLSLYSEGLKGIQKNRGYLQFIISKNISKSDFVQIKKGYKLKEYVRNLTQSMKESVLTKEVRDNLNTLAFMIADGCAEVKFALIPNELGIFHDKFGLIKSDNETVFFNGSVNETRAGLKNNYESISVDVSWDTSVNVKMRIKSSEERFQKLWDGKEDGVITVEATDLVYDELKKNRIDKNTISEEITEDFKGIYFYLESSRIIRKDTSTNFITSKDRKLRLGSDLSMKYFEGNNSTVKKNFSYMDVEYVIEETKKRCIRKNIDVKVSKELEYYLLDNKYSINEYKKLGQYLKIPNDLELGSELDKYEEFSKIVQSEVERPLKDLQMRAAYYEYRMARAANFSVPGAGKTAMILGVFAYLNRENTTLTNERVDKILVVCPINAFESWKDEFRKVFGSKKELKTVDCQNTQDFSRELSIHWKGLNLVLINYEAVPKYLSQLKSLVDANTMLVFDEVHRIKNPDGQRAQASLKLVTAPKFKFVLTGTPIPNSYQDIYNFLHILYDSEYSAYFKWTIDDLKNPKAGKINEINNSLFPFFWRVDKKSLGVPEADPDEFIVVNPSQEQKDLAESIFYTEKSSLARLIRLIQASTNPALVTKEITYADMGFSDEGDATEISEGDFYDKLNDYSEEDVRKVKDYTEYDLTSIQSPKFEAGIEKILSLVSEGKKVIVWAIFVDTMKKIENRLQTESINCELIYGGVSVSKRPTLINKFKGGEVSVLISNPQTLGESVSLHESVHDAVYFEYNFNLTYMLQSRDRIHRLGLGENQYTHYYYLQTKSEPSGSDRAGYIDSKIYEKLKRKEEIMQQAIDSGKLSLDFSENEIEEAIEIIEAERSRMRQNRR